MDGHIYNRTVHGLLFWCKIELEYAGNIRCINDQDLRSASALSSLHVMDQIKYILFKMLDNPEYELYKSHLLYFHNIIIRVMENLIMEYLISGP
jgi:hypothetical protein